jgi:hypothetical protein
MSRGAGQSRPDIEAAMKMVEDTAQHGTSAERLTGYSGICKTE